MSRASGYIDGLISGATWGVVGVLLAGLPSRMPGHQPVVRVLVIAAVFEAAAAAFLFARSALSGALPALLRVITSRTAITVATCSLLGGPLFMGCYVAALMLAGPADALTATAAYPVFSALLSRRAPGKPLNRTAWLGITATGLGAALTALDASSSASGPRTLAGIAIALIAAAGMALEGNVATRVMTRVDASTAMAARMGFSAMMFAVTLLAVPGGVAAATSAARTGDLYLLIIAAGLVGGYSYAVWYHAIRKIGAPRAMALNITYALWGTLFAWAFQHAKISFLALTGCVIVSIGAVLTIMSGEHSFGGTRDEQQENFDPQGVPRRGPARHPHAP
jgi:drug/metabolite transporter (DMT)-like permease